MKDRVSLILLPGLDGTRILLEPLLAVLPDWVRPVVVPYPNDGPTGYGDLLPEVERVLRAEGASFVLGWSFGGPLATQLAARRPELVLGLILCSSFVHAPRRELVRWRAFVSPPVVGTLRAVRRIRYLIPGFAEPALRLAKRRTWRAVGARALASRSREVLVVDVRHELAAYRGPVLCLAAENDSVISSAHAREILALAPAATAASIPGGHMALFTAASAGATQIAAFLASHVRPEELPAYASAQLASTKVAATAGRMISRLPAN